MGQMTWSAADLRTSAKEYAACADGLNTLAGDVTPLNPAAYGLLVENAAQGAEPATSRAHQHVLNAMAATTEQIGAELLDASLRYAEVEESAVALINRLLAAIRSII